MYTYDYPANKTTYNEGMATTTEPEVKALLGELEKEIYVLKENLGGLKARLEVVMLPEVIKSNKDVPPAVAPVHSELFMRINALRVSLVDMNIQVSDIKQRLEV